MRHFEFTSSCERDRAAQCVACDIDGALPVYTAPLVAMKQPIRKEVSSLLGGNTRRPPSALIMPFTQPQNDRKCRRISKDRGSGHTSNEYTHDTMKEF